MSEENKTIRKAFTVITSPVWVPVAAVGGAVHGIGDGELTIAPRPHSQTILENIVSLFLQDL